MGKGMAGALCLWVALMGVAVAGETIAPMVTEYGESLEPQRIVVTATRIPTPVEQVAGPVTVFEGGTPGGSQVGRLADGIYSAGNFETRQYRGLGEVLQNVPGVSLYTSGGNGTSSSVFMRGMDSGNTVLLVDGMPMNDPGDTNGSFNFGQFVLDNVAQVEVLRGPQSTLHGSGATGGVINIMSKKGEGPLSGYASTEAGSRGTFLTRLGMDAGNEKGDFSVAGSVFHTDGYSVADKRNGNTEKDRYRYGNINIRLGFNPTNSLRFDLFANALKDEKEYDGWLGNTAADASDLFSKTERYMVRPQASLLLMDGRWEQTVGIGYMQTYRKAFGDSFYDRYKFKGETLKIDYKSIFHIHETNTLLAGVDVVTESMTKYDGTASDRYTRTKPDKVTTTGFYIEDQINIDDTFFANFGVRQVHHDDFGDKTVWKANTMYVLPTNTKLKASVGTGFKAPTIDQLHIDYDFGGFYDTFSNPNLKAERTFGWDVGFEQSLFCDKLVFGSTFFHNKVKDKIATVLTNPVNYTYSYANIDTYKAWGVESFLQLALTDNLVFSAQHTFLRMDLDGQIRGRRPKHSASANIDYQFNEKGTMTFGYVYVGKRADFNAGDVNLPSHSVFRVGAKWKLNDNFEIFGRVENLFNKKYSQIRGFGTERLSFFGGITASF
ncbi:MAG: TonB-dependent receptor [Planctomycetaceae bacterium]|nr:TonB-dependent receptor [Planctomycetaceae bacterium]